MPCRRIGRSSSTTPWSKSISITRSATMHSRPIETCWKAEIVHSWPSTVLAPIETSPSWARIFVPWPIHDQRPSRTTASRPISNVTPGPTKHSPSVCRRPRQRSFSHAQRSDQPRVLAVEHAVAAHEAQQRERPAVERGRRAADLQRPRRGLRRRADMRRDPSYAAIMPPLDGRQGRKPRRAPARGRQARAGARHLARRGRRPRGLGARARGLPAHRHRAASSASPARPAPASRR